LSDKRDDNWGLHNRAIYGWQATEVLPDPDAEFSRGCSIVR